MFVTILLPRIERSKKSKENLARHDCLNVLLSQTFKKFPRHDQLLFFDGAIAPKVHYLVITVGSSV